MFFIDALNSTAFVGFLQSIFNRLNINKELVEHMLGVVFPSSFDWGPHFFKKGQLVFHHVALDSILSL